LNTIPTELNSLRRRPWHSGHSVSAASVKDCCTSNRCSQVVHA